MQVASLLGCALILLGYAGLQAGRLARTSATFNGLNLVGSLALLWVALVDHRAGFIVLEAAWVVISLLALARRSA